MELLIVEDDLFKYSRIKKLIKDKSVKIKKTDNVHDTVRYLEYNTPDKIILDMSLPCHEIKRGEGSPISMPNGGIEVVLELNYQNKNNIPLIILTQYDDIEIEDNYYSIEDSASVIRDLFGVNLFDVIFYDNDSTNWEERTTQFIEEIDGNIID